jgi:hypothetical protein
VSIQTEIVSMHERMLRMGASPECAHAVALALYHELVPGCDSCTADEAVTRALTKAKAAQPATADDGRANGVRRIEPIGPWARSSSAHR